MSKRKRKHSEAEGDAGQARSGGKGGTRGVGSDQGSPAFQPMAWSKSPAATTTAAAVQDEDGPRDCDGLLLPRIVTSLWEHQTRSRAAVLLGVREGKRGFADASAVGAGKTLTALATCVGVAEHIVAVGQHRHGVLIMLPTPALLGEWLREVAKHTRGYHVIEQRKTGKHVWVAAFMADVRAARVTCHLSTNAHGITNTQNPCVWLALARRALVDDF